MSYKALYNKYRSQTFDEIVGQKAVVTILKNSLSTNKISHVRYDNQDFKITGYNVLTKVCKIENDDNVEFVNLDILNHHEIKAEVMPEVKMK